MLNNMIGGMPGLDLLLQQQLLLWFEEPEERQPIIGTVSWLCESKADPEGPPPDTDAWTCPRCRSHRCIRTNPGNVHDAVYCCSVCGYTFHAASAARLPSSED